MKWTWEKITEEEQQQLQDDAYSHHYHTVKEIEELLENRGFGSHEDLENIGDSHYRTKINHDKKKETVFVTTKINESERFAVFVGSETKNRKFLLQDVILNKPKGQEIRRKSIRSVLELIGLLSRKATKKKRPQAVESERKINYAEFNHTKIPDVIETLDYREFNTVNGKATKKPRTFFGKVFGHRSTSESH